MLLLLTYYSATCGGTISGSQGSIMSPNYPANYENSQSCEWYIRAPTGHYLTFTFEALQLEAAQVGSCVDNVDIRDNYTGKHLNTGNTLYR